MHHHNIRSQFRPSAAGAARAALLTVALLAALAMEGSQLFAMAPRSSGTPLAVQVAVQAPALVGAPVSLNPQFQALALAQGPLSPVAWPTPAWSGTTGTHGTYGWTHSFSVTQATVAGIVQSYAARPVFYDHAPMREAGYGPGGRPKGWAPESPVDLAGGEWAGPGGVQVSGLDIEHFGLGPLFAVADSHGLVVQTPAGPKPADLVARELLRGLLRAHAGMFRSQWGLVGYVESGRVSHWAIRSLVDGAKRGLIEPADAATLAAYLTERILPAVETGLAPLRVYNDLCWVLPALYDAYLLCPDRALRGRIWSALRTLAEREGRLAVLLPGRACQVEEVATWAPELTASGCKITEYLEPWEVRSMFVAAAVLGESPAADACRAEASVAAARWKGKPAALPWLVGPDGGQLSGVGQ